MRKLLITIGWLTTLCVLIFSNDIVSAVVSLLAAVAIHSGVFFKGSGPRPEILKEIAPPAPEWTQAPSPDATKFAPTDTPINGVNYDVPTYLRQYRAPPVLASLPGKPKKRRKKITLMDPAGSHFDGHTEGENLHVLAGEYEPHEMIPHDFIHPSEHDHVH